MSITHVAISVSKIVVATYRILATSVMGYYLVKELIIRRKDGRVHARDGRGPSPK